MKSFASATSLTNVPAFTVATRAYGTLKRLIFLVMRLGTCKAKQLSRKEESIPPEKMFLGYSKSNLVRRASRDKMLKKLSR